MNRAWLIVFGDFISFLISFILLIFIRFSPGDYIFAINTHTSPFIILYLFWVLIFYVFGLYDLVTIKPTIPYLKRWILALTSSFVIGLLLFYFVPIFGISPKINLFIQVALFGFFSFLFRRIIYTLFARAITRPTILIGDSSYLNELKNTIEKNPQIGLSVVGHYKNINEFDLKDINLNNILLILDKNSETLEENILNIYKKGIDIIDTAKAYEKYLFKIPVEYIDMTFVVENINIKKDMAYKILTFIINNIFAITILIISSPIMLIAVVARLIEDGRPIFIKQKRVGLNGKIFNLYKMRSMIVLSPDGSAETTKAIWSTGTNDKRITPVGKIIRKLHIDEIPQMINIIKGDISLVGPRPERPEFVYPLENTIPHYKLRHVIRPGFTGWAQIKYRYASTVKDSKEKFEYDLYYIKNRNIFLDFGIIMRTIQIIFTH
jgi:lipopolysaccharide/colanic/teichoic acid biosynthesis glycosyltransferase